MKQMADKRGTAMLGSVPGLPYEDERHEGLEEARRRIAEALENTTDELVLADLRLTFVPENIVKLKELRSLALNNNRLTSFPEAVCELTDLSSLDLSSNDLTLIPDEICRLTNLGQLNVAGNAISAFPSTIGKLHKLKYLQASDNQLTGLPTDIGDCAQLNFLDLHGNNLHELPDTIGNLEHLITVNVADNAINTFPQTIGKLKKLSYLDASMNRISNLEVLCQITQLHSLYLLGNELSEIPSCIAQLSQLKHFSAAGNKIRLVPESIGDMRRLRDLYLDRNELAELPESIRQLTDLEHLYLSNNQLGLPEEVLRSNRPVDILEYYFRTRGGARPLNEIKLIVLGYGDVGKTCLVKRLLHDTFEVNEQKTEGINISDWVVRLGGKEDVRLHVWDFGGQEIMHATHQFFLTERSLYLLVLNGRQGKEGADAQYWLSLISSFAKDYRSSWS